MSSDKINGLITTVTNTLIVKPAKTKKTFDPNIYKGSLKTYTNKNKWMNLGRWLLPIFISRYPFSPNPKYQGLSYIALGHGDSSWGTSPPDPDVTDTKLYDEYYRQEIDLKSYRLVTREQQNLVSYSGNTLIEIDSSIPEANYPQYVGLTIQLETTDPSTYEERFIIGYQKGTKNYWVLHSPLSGTPSGSYYWIFKPISMSENTLPTLKSLTIAYSELEVIISSDDANGEIREFGLFGAWASKTKDSGVIWNIIRHAPHTKQNLIWIVKRIRFEFS